VRSSQLPRQLEGKAQNPIHSLAREYRRLHDPFGDAPERIASPQLRILPSVFSRTIQKSISPRPRSRNGHEIPLSSRTGRRLTY
jgi:hypothetical protein